MVGILKIILKVPLIRGLLLIVTVIAIKRCLLKQFIIDRRHYIYDKTTKSDVVLYVENWIYVLAQEVYFLLLWCITTVI